MGKLYRKKGLIEAERWMPGMNMDGVTINDLDKQGGSPRDGDMIARDPSNPRDSWLISSAYFEANYEEADKRSRS
jgi:hypothetical protein